MTWSPDPAWSSVPGTHGPTTEGLWIHHDRVFKRLRPSDHNWEPWHVGYWRREAEVAIHPWLVDGPGLVPTGFHSVAEDPTGITIESEFVTGPLPTNLQVADALGRFAESSYQEAAWFTRGLLPCRIAILEDNGGWSAMARTSIGDLCQTLWDERHTLLEKLETGPQGRHHGDPTPKNFLTTRDREVVAIDWQCLGVGPVGVDLGYWALSAKEDFDVLADVYVGQQPARTEILLAARVMLAFTVISRANQAIAQAFRLGIPLESLQKHPSVSPHLRALQRHLPQVEALTR